MIGNLGMRTIYKIKSDLIPRKTWKINLLINISYYNQLLKRNYEIDIVRLKKHGRIQLSFRDVGVS
jgi:hypothetical protein